MKTIDLSNMDDFREVSDNWQIAGGVQSNRNSELDLRPTEGTGVLANTPTEENQEHLFTTWEHNDLELELDFLMPKGSNSGIYLMGRYEVQLLDSWGVDDPQHSDVGGIYQRWDESRPEGEKGFEGHPPRMNAARAPGLWQHYRILFSGPEFNDAGEKIANARFEEVWLNGVLVQEDVEVTGPTRAAFYEDEQPAGPLMIQGDHGPVAIRNIRYKRYDKKSIALNDLTYSYYGEAFDQLPDFSTLEAGQTGSADSLNGNIVQQDDRYALRYSGTLQAPNTGTYLFKLRTAGTARMLIDGQVIFDQDSVQRMHELTTRTIDLEGGAHEFVFEYIDHPNNWYSGLSLYAEGPRLRLQKLHSSASVPGGDRELPDLIVDVDDRVKTLRSFAMHEGSKRTHVINVGAPNGINYNYDMGQGALLHAWEGPFVNTNEMWINRGQPQIAKPAGPPIAFEGKPIVAALNSGTASWPDSVSWDMLDVQGYSISEQGWPVFRYTYGELSVEDRLEGTEENRRLTRTVRFSGSETGSDYWFLLASGRDITRNEDEYVVDDRSFYLNLLDAGGAEPQLVQTHSGHDLRVNVPAGGSESTITFEIIW
ncbi:MAG: family 16 glycoside hydrolase [Balneolaceae bacterium]|nr:family 16 glycoside hydrolase [Balneolaceae bacterium]